MDSNIVIIARSRGGNRGVVFSSIKLFTSASTFCTRKCRYVQERGDPRTDNPPKRRPTLNALLGKK